MTSNEEIESKTEREDSNQVYAEFSSGKRRYSRTYFQWSREWKHPDRI